MQTKSILQYALLFLLLNNFAYAQIGIGTPSPNSSAMLDIKSANKGVLFPSIALKSLTDNTTIPTPAEGLLVWNNGSGGLSAAGFYYWNNLQWNFISTSGTNSPNNNINSTGWNLTGTNSGNYSGANTGLSLGTNTLDDLVLKVNSATMGRLGANNSISFGSAANAAQNGIALGNSSSAYQGIAIGTNASVNANESVAIGANTQISGYQSTAVGYNAKVTVNEATAVGNNANASGFQSIALGFNAKTSVNDATAVGKNSLANGYQSIAMGYNAKTSSNGETALGINSQTNGQNSTALGSGASATGQNSTAIGYNASTSQANAIVLGDNNANIGIGTNTPNNTAKLDVNGQYKLGDRGTVNKNQINFEVWPSVSINNLASGKSTTLNITIPPALIPGTSRGTIVVSPAGDFAGNANFAISNPRMTSNAVITINLINISNGAESLYSSHFYVTINEF
ncbi:Head domain of trimeric autotransporter adhesin [Chryseobacterium soldanellicola]|uniref:Head domain of trimeric autotransporter adhesin n=1 Tax=Chryseobacterium soldanellicola TaxID=311333 RepID=A0A1H1GLV5_9FLAO|nr:hypothetical protein [Chryseobacterium soldanellicola]SDR14111.1 Head domain of trimeric autotransporter adhesin [Chryseobacterium soldanellicola]